MNNCLKNLIVIAIPLLAFGGVHYATQKKQVPPTPTITELADNMRFGLETGHGLRDGAAADAPATVLEVEMVETLPDMGMERVLARRGDGVIFSAIAGLNKFKKGDMVVFRGLVNQIHKNQVSNPQCIYVAQPAKQ